MSARSGRIARKAPTKPLTLLASDGTELNIDTRVEGGRRGTEDYDTGYVVKVHDEKALVAWDSETQTWTHASLLRGEAS